MRNPSLKCQILRPPKTNSKAKCSRDSLTLEKPPSPNRKRKRSQEAEDSLSSLNDTSHQKRARTQVGSCLAPDTLPRKTEIDIGDHRSPINYWIQRGRWPKEYFQSNIRLRQDHEQACWIKELAHEASFKEQLTQKSVMPHYFLARKKSSASLDRQSSGAPSDQSGEFKSAPYRHAGYETLLATKGSFMIKSKIGITNASTSTYKKMLSEEQAVPKDSLFNDELFEALCQKVQTRNEAMIVQDVTRLIVPSAQNLAICGATHLQFLIESVNEAWTNCIPVTQTRPQPDYSVGFSRYAFTEDRLKKIQPFVGGLCDTSFIMATWQMYFPFLTCEVKCCAAALEIADRQNAHSMTVAVRGVVELYKYVKREKELHREILAFSVSHDNEAVRIYGHYPLIDEAKITFHRHSIHKFYFTTLNGKEKWTAYKFIKNVYDKWMPDHLKRICSAIDDIPSNINLELSQSASLMEQSGLQNSQQSNAEPMSGLEEDALADSQELINSQDTVTFKKPRLTANAMLKEQIDELKRENDRQRQEMKQEVEGLKEQNKELMSILKQKLT